MSIHFRGQFIAPLPIKVSIDDGGILEELGGSLHGVAARIGRERKSFLDWLGDRVGADPRSLPGKRMLAAYDTHAVGELLPLLSRSANRLTIDPGSRAFRDQFAQEHAASVETLQASLSDLTDSRVKPISSSTTPTASLRPTATSLMRGIATPELRLPESGIG